MNSQLITIPKELLGEIITHVPLSDLIELCQSDKFISNLCNNDRLLSMVIQEQTGYTSKPEQFSWRQFAILLGRNEIKQVNVIYKNKTVGNIWLQPTEKLALVIGEILALYSGNMNDLAIKFNYNIYILIPDTLFERNTIINQYPSQNNSIWVNTEEIEIIDDPTEINKIINRCRKCSSFNTISMQIQTRAADEPITSYINCRDCGSNLRI